MSSTASVNAPHSVDGNGVSRRAVLRAAAWSVPAIAVVTAVPAFAASGNEVPNNAVATARLLPNQSTTVSRCSTLDGVTLELLADGAPVSGEQTVTLSLPNGLSLNTPDGPSTALIPVINGYATLPKIYVQPDVAGAYSLAATWNFTREDNSAETLTTSLPLNVTAPLVPAYLMTRAGTTPAAGFTQTDLTFTNPQGGAVSEFQQVVIDGGTVKYWGALVGGNTASSPGTLQAAGANITNVVPDLLAAWSGRTDAASHNERNTAGGIVVSRTAGTDRVYTWSHNTSTTQPTATLVTAPAGGWGTVRQVTSDRLGSYVLSSTGLFFVAPDRTVTKIYDNPTQINSINSWGEFSDQGVNAITTSGGVLQSSGANQLAALSLPVGTVARSIESHGNYDFIVTAAGSVLRRFNGGAWVTGFGGLSEGQDAANRVLAISTWRQGTWAGGTTVNADGSVTVFVLANGLKPTGPMTYVLDKADFGGEPVIAVFANDGLFLALTESGRLWGWSGNPNNTNVATIDPTERASGIATADIWARHFGSSEYYGGGFAGGQLAACAI